MIEAFAQKKLNEYERAVLTLVLRTNLGMNLVFGRPNPQSRFTEVPASAVRTLVSGHGPNRMSSEVVRFFDALESSPIVGYRLSGDETARQLARMSLAARAIRMRPPSIPVRTVPSLYSLNEIVLIYSQITDHEVRAKYRDTAFGDEYGNWLGKLVLQSTTVPGGLLEDQVRQVREALGPQIDWRWLSYSPDPPTGPYGGLMSPRRMKPIID